MQKVADEIWWKFLMIFKKNILLFEIVTFVNIKDYDDEGY
jgi:hypothetical protein